jgi:hypothetical protein
MFPWRQAVFSLRPDPCVWVEHGFLFWQLSWKRERQAINQSVNQSINQLNK